MSLIKNDLESIINILNKKETPQNNDGNSSEKDEELSECEIHHLKSTHEERSSNIISPIPKHKSNIDKKSDRNEGDTEEEDNDDQDKDKENGEDQENKDENKENCEKVKKNKDSYEKAKKHFIKNPGSSPIQELPPQQQMPPQQQIPTQQQFLKTGQNSENAPEYDLLNKLILSLKELMGKNNIGNDNQGVNNVGNNNRGFTEVFGS